MNVHHQHFLVTMWEGAGLVAAELTVVRHLIDRGHRVSVLADPPIRAEAEAAGATFLPWRSAPVRLTRDPRDDLVSDWQTSSPFELMKRMRERFVVDPADRFAADVAEAIDEVKPDVVVNDVLLLGAHVAAEASGLPAVALVPNIYLFPAKGSPPFGTGWAAPVTAFDRARSRLVDALITNLWNKGLPTLNSVRSSYGLAPVTTLWQQLDHLDEVLVLTSAEFDIKAELPSNVHYVGAQLDDPAWAAESPWQPPFGDAPLVVVSLSSGYQDQGSLLHTIIDVLAAMPVRAVVSTGLGLDPAEFPSTAAVHVHRAVPHHRALRDAAVVVTHGGHGTLLKALSAGVPAVCIPMGRDQADNAARLERTGAGVRVSPRNVARSLASAVNDVLMNREYSEAAARISSRLAADDTEPPRVVERLEALVAHARA